MIRRYSELRSLPTFLDRFRYLQLHGNVGEDTFGYDRYLNQILYHSSEWRDARHQVIIRDNGCDLGVPGREIYDQIIVHHLNPVTKDDLIAHSEWLVDPEFLICTSLNTHNAIHYGDERLLGENITERRANDTSPWL